ncbi:MAG TPA: hypothetical protein PKW82_04635 [Spirochaetales bacterium]|nr:hypothetical protein [Spirochaetales bacterium]
MPSAASQVLVSIIPIVGIVMGSVVIFFWMLWSHREKVAMIEKGLYRPASLDLVILSLFAGILLSSVGAVLTVMLSLLDGFGYGLLGGVIPLAVGIGLVVFYVLGRKAVDGNGRA